MNSKEFFIQVYAPWIKESKGRILDLSKSKKELGQIKNCLESLKQELKQFNGLFKDEGELLTALWQFFCTSPEFDWVADKCIASFSGNVTRCVDRYREVMNNENTRIYNKLTSIEREYLERELKELIPDRSSPARIGASLRKELGEIS